MIYAQKQISGIPVAFFRLLSRRRIWALIFFVLPLSVFPQLTKIMGNIKDSATGEPLPFVNIIILKTTDGTLTDFEGRYALEVNTKGDSIRYSLLGYKTVTRKILKHQFQALDILLAENNILLPEVTIHYTGNPAEIILKKVVKNREKNSLQAFESYQYRAYTKIEIDANNITDKFKNRKLLKPFNFVFNYIDTSTLTGKSYLPVFLTETTSDVFFRKNPKARKEIITGSKISGLENESISQFLGNLSLEIDVYKDYIPLFEKNFVCPAASFGIDYYRYYLVDSAFLEGKWSYHIMFKPRHKQQLTFSGNLWVCDTSFAIKKIEMRIATDANINFVNDLAIQQEYQWTQNKFWIKTKDHLVIDFNIVQKSKKIIGFFGHKTTFFSDFQFDTPENKRFYSLPTNVFIEPKASEKTDAFWQELRPEKLSKSETGIYKMVDSVKNIPIFKTYRDVIYGIVTGYLPWGNWEFGPYFKTFSFNTLEGARFRLGARTGDGFSRKIQLEGYVAYGVSDLTYKGGADVIWVYSKNPRRDFTAGLKYDIEQLGMSPNAFAADNILSSLFHRGPNNKLTMVTEYKVGYEHEWFTGLINTIKLTHRELFPLGTTDFTLYPENNGVAVDMPVINTSEISLGARLSFKERFISTDIYRFTISSDYPIIQLTYSYGFPKLLNSNFEYNKLVVNVSQWFNFATIGWSKYMIEGGKIWGTLPYPLLRIHDGNQTFLYDELASNLMYYYEFVSDEYINFFYTHHFDGLLFNKIPLLRKLKWREVVSTRLIYGALSQKNLTYSKFPDIMHPIGATPYWEATAGIENIFRFIRVDAVWRLTHQHDIQNPHVPTWGVFVSLNFSF
ncbi:MAG: DUF5686 family protein [Bacteroidetes bacterium]|nr:DUF5686 family protein [Bacteroidota bacterium]